MDVKIDSRYVYTKPLRSEPRPQALQESPCLGFKGLGFRVEAAVPKPFGHETPAGRGRSRPLSSNVRNVRRDWICDFAVRLRRADPLELATSVFNLYSEHLSSYFQSDSVVL